VTNEIYYLIKKNHYHSQVESNSYNISMNTSAKHELGSNVTHRSVDEFKLHILNCLDFYFTFYHLFNALSNKTINSNNKKMLLGIKYISYAWGYWKHNSI
jgi:hypothetical protein